MAQAAGPMEAVSEAQEILRADGADIIADGRWGSYTHGAYEKASPVARMEVDALLSSKGLSAEQLITANRAAKAARDSQYIAAKNEARRGRQRSVTASPEVAAALREAAATVGVPEATMFGFAKIESGFNPAAVHGRSRGLLQFQPGAWSDVQEIDPSIGPYFPNVWDARKNALAGARYLKINEKRLRGEGYTGPLTPEVMYLAHQQGAAGFTEMWKAANGIPHRPRHVTPEKMRKNPPQDRQGITFDKVEFYRRWLAAAKAKIDS